MCGAFPALRNCSADDEALQRMDAGCGPIAGNQWNAAIRYSKPLEMLLGREPKPDCIRSAGSSGPSQRMAGFTQALKLVSWLTFGSRGSRCSLHCAYALWTESVRLCVRQRPLFNVALLPRDTYIDVIRGSLCTTPPRVRCTWIRSFQKSKVPPPPLSEGRFDFVKGPRSNPPLEGPRHPAPQ